MCYKLGNIWEQLKTLSVLFQELPIHSSNQKINLFNPKDLKILKKYLRIPFVQIRFFDSFSNSCKTIHLII